ncbi:MAG TPA: thioredoxin domain-containing protein [Pyrinomonadaceae bacterium]|nr:thioredoxin domain-containing protein [Pyrinomonadaceae bacterium]
MKTFLPLLIILAVLGVAMGSVWYLTRPAEVTPIPAASQTPARPANSPGATPARQAVNQGVPGAEPPHTHGPANAPIHIEEFGDFQCPPCGVFHPILEQMEAEFGDNIRVTYRQFPLVPTHRHALVAASASEAAGLQGKFWQMHKLIFDNQLKWKDEFDVRPVFEGYAKQIGLNIEQYNRDLNGDVVAQRIFQDGKRAHSLGVKGTPTVFLNGREVPFQSLAPEKFRVVIQNELRSGGK